MEFAIATEPVHSPGPQSLMLAAQDELNRRYGPDTDAIDLHFDEMVAPRGAFVVARLDGHLAGGVALRTILDRSQHVGEIKRLWVRPDLRGSGVAQLIMNYAEDEARSLEMTRLYLESGDRQPEALAFYPKVGWTRVDAFPPGAFAYPRGLKFTKEL